MGCNRTISSSSGPAGAAPADSDCTGVPVLYEVSSTEYYTVTNPNYEIITDGVNHLNDMDIDLPAGSYVAEFSSHVLNTISYRYLHIAFFIGKNIIPSSYRKICCETGGEYDDIHCDSIEFDIAEGGETVTVKCYYEIISSDLGSMSIRARSFHIKKTDIS